MNRLENPAAVIRDNTNKRYLQRLAAQGIATVPTVFVDQGPPPSFSALRAQLPVATGYVIKPTVGAGSRDTVKVAASSDGDAEADAFMADVAVREALMVQPFLPSIASGELSLIYVDGVLSHAINKIPAQGDFRSQPEFGSRIVAVEVNAAVKDLADRAVTAVGAGALLFARIDVVFGLDGAPCVIEAELTEPSLYLGWSDDVAGRVADAIIRRLSPV